MKEHAQRPAQQHESIMQNSNADVLMCPLTMSLSHKIAALLDKEGHAVCEPDPASVQIHVLLGART